MQIGICRAPVRSSVIHPYHRHPRYGTAILGRGVGTGLRAVAVRFHDIDPDGRTHADSVGRVFRCLPVDDHLRSQLRLPLPGRQHRDAHLGAHPHRGHRHHRHNRLHPSLGYLPQLQRMPARCGEGQPSKGESTAVSNAGRGHLHYDPTGHAITAAFTLCTADGLGGMCADRTIHFTPLAARGRGRRSSLTLMSPESV